MMHYILTLTFLINQSVYSKDCFNCKKKHQLILMFLNFDYSTLTLPPELTFLLSVFGSLS